MSNKIYKDKKFTVRLLCVILVFALLCSCIFALFLINKKSVAYLHDDNSITVDYSVAQLSFDVSSNHMYSYYTEDSNYNSVVEDVLNNLNELTKKLDNSQITIEDYNTSVKSQLKKYYDSDMIDSLQKAYNNFKNQDDYNDEVMSIYNKYYTKYQFMFKIKNLQIASMEKGKSIWYYYAKDMTDTFLKEYVVQHNATATNQSTIKIGVKLKGGTTYNNDETQYYYDDNFNDMVTPQTYRFNNTGNVSLFMNFGLNMNNDGSVDLGENGVLGMILPYGLTFESLKSNDTYKAYYNTNTKKWNYHNLIKALITNNQSEFSGITFSGTDSKDVIGSLTYSSMKSVLNKWNQYAMSTYLKNSNVNDKNNYLIIPEDSTNTGLKQLQMSVMYWADYKTISDYYNKTENLSFKDDTKYKLMCCDVNLDVKTSLKNNDLSTLSDTDWEELFNKRETYNKFAGVSNFESEGYGYFVQTKDGTTTIENAKNYMDGGYIVADYVNKNAVNYIGNFRFDIRYRGYSPAYTRVQLIEQFTNKKGEIEAVNPIPFKLGNSFVDNRIKDLYFYSDNQFYSTDNSSLTQAGKAKLLSIPVITGVDGVSSPGDIDSTLTKKTDLKLKLYLQVDTVQPNRIDEYWNVSLDDIINMK